MEYDFERRFRDAWSEIRARGNSKDFLNYLISLYEQPHRKYHGLNHIKECLMELEQVMAYASYPEVIVMAIWFHDAIYYPREKDNEEKSAALATGIMKSANALPRVVKNIREYVMATKGHTDIGKKYYDIDLFVDIDLSILGKPEDRFDEYDEQIRDEYSFVPIEEYRKGRISLLQKFLARKRIYQTRPFYNKYESQARQNIERAIDRLQHP